MNIIHYNKNMGQFHILAVDDSELDRELISLAIKQLGITDLKLQVVDSPENFFKLRNRHDLYLIDMEMGVANLTGTKVIERLEVENDETPRVILTGHVDEVVLKDVKAAGANAFVTKASFEELKASLSKVIDKYRLHSFS